MNVLMIGDVPRETQTMIAGVFPGDWRLVFAVPEDAEPFLAEAEALIPEHVRVDESFLRRAPRLRMIQTGAGYDNIDLAACARRGVRVCNAAGINAAAVAEHALALILCWYKSVALLDRYMKQELPAAVTAYRGAELEGKTLGIVGMGRIGSRLSRVCQALGMKVLGCGRRLFDPALGEQTELEELLRRADIVSLHVPLNDATRHSFGAAQFSLMKRGALFVNVSRGALADEEALAGALRSGQLGGACLDVYEREPLAPDSPLRTLKNVILTPHTAGLPDAPKFHRRRFEFFAANIARFFRGEQPENALN
ncbi:MAG: hypothetical protein IJ233_07025 [Pyramidobacter sp.]|nr:hypothetical protein [Pyramidobacter sp.]